MISFLLLSLASTASASSSIPLVRRSHSGIFSPEDLASQRDALDSKYGHVAGKVQPRQDGAGVPMVNQNADTSYYAVMSVGTPPTPYGVALGECAGSLRSH